MHHPRPETLYESAAGRLPPPHEALVAAHNALCPLCAFGWNQARRAIGERLAAMEAPAIPPDAMDRAFHRLQDRASRAQFLPPSMTAQAVPPPLVVDWRSSVARAQWIAPGLRLVTLSRDAAGNALHLIRAEPDAVTPMHRHRGPEVTLVMQGRMISDGAEFGPGCMADFPAEQEHSQKAIGDEPCVSLVATAGGRLRFRSILARLYQRFIGI